MNSSDLDDLNNRFGLTDQLTFIIGEGGLRFARVSTPQATAQVCLQGAHVTAFQPNGQQPVLWVSSETAWQEGKAIRGGVPVCWPWFADHPGDASMPAHGFARTSLWDVVDSAIEDDGSLRLQMSLPADAGQGVGFGEKIELRLVVKVSTELTLELTTINRSESVFEITEALHSYLTVGDISKVRCAGLDGVDYRDKVDGFRSKTQQGDVEFPDRTDRIYENTTGAVQVHDAALERALRIGKSGSDTTVVWNPGPDLSHSMADLADDSYRTMVCVEAANAGVNAVRIEPGASHTLATTIAVQQRN